MNRALREAAGLYLRWLSKFYTHPTSQLVTCCTINRRDDFARRIDISCAQQEKQRKLELAKNMPLDQCALTGNYGKFVKCHILPQAFTKPAINGAPLYQSSRGQGERRRWTSWYDHNLVTRDGEDLLSAIDDNAIKLLRKHHLVWSSWILFRPHIEPISPAMPDHGYRKLHIPDSEALIRFALSIAWRASASSLPDMEDATLTPEIQSRLRDYVLGERIDKTSEFPVSLIQISTLGEIHNHSPYVDEKKFVGLDDSDRESLRILRIYVDGLVFHVHLSPIPDEHMQNNPLYLGASDSTVITTVSYEASFQYENMLHAIRETFI